jgi:hypothetical protein
VIFVHGLSTIYVDDRPLQIEHGSPNEPLEEDEYIGEQRHLAMDTLEPRFWVRRFVHLDHNQARNSQGHRQRVECRVDICTPNLVFLSCGGLEDQYAFGEQ